MCPVLILVQFQWWDKCRVYFTLEQGPQTQMSWGPLLQQISVPHMFSVVTEVFILLIFVHGFKLCRKIYIYINVLYILHNIMVQTASTFDLIFKWPTKACFIIHRGQMWGIYGPNVAPRTKILKPQPLKIRWVLKNSKSSVLHKKKGFNREKIKKQNKTATACSTCSSV